VFVGGWVHALQCAGHASRIGAVEHAAAEASAAHPGASGP
jgi:hypothetical protein